jgi:predicted O-methyltransferase YrrM
MIEQTYADIVSNKLLKGAIENNEYTGFREDYHVIHCLLKMYAPKSVFEIGTNMGTGTKIIKNAVGVEAVVFSLDLPTELAHVSLQHPISEGKGDRVGKNCNLPFIQLRGDSMTFDFGKYPCEAAYIDGEHDYSHPFHEATQMIANDTRVIIFHDSDMPEVYRAIEDAFKNVLDYDVYRVTDTRIAYAVKKEQ